MGSPVLTTGSVILCPHAGTTSIVPGNPRVRMMGQPVATMSDQFLIAGCAFTVPGPKPQPCMTIRWMVPSLRVRAGGNPVLLQSSTGLCLSAEQIPAGPPNPTLVQPRVKAT